MARSLLPAGTADGLKLARRPMPGSVPESRWQVSHWWLFRSPCCSWWRTDGAPFLAPTAAPGMTCTGMR
jgi:hypothetical protein